ncbi:hypothetical protein OS493_000207 [Desmophyllum pertusum]|uniref:Uncharacterized protein n=1 Tax=Desmophyllum pertusum TaxID=174260 RepID=A0A9X0A6P9_9CNID|nr:hypothetical protein OS493_000207 [Desmophyllum pertusum]
MPQDLNSTNTCIAHRDSKSNSKLSIASRTAVVIPSEASSEHNCGLRLQDVQRSYLQRIKSRSNRKNESKKKTKPPGLTLLEILCADFENGILLTKRTGNQSDSSLGYKSAHKTGLREKPLLSDSDKSLKSEGNKESSIRSHSSQDESRHETEISDAEKILNNSVSRSKSVSFEALNSDNSLKTLSLSTMGLSSLENIPLQDRSAQNLNWTSRDSMNNFDLGEIGKGLQTAGQSDEGNSLGEMAGKRSASSCIATRNEESISSNHTCLESSLEAQTSDNCRFVHYKEGRKVTRKKGKKQSSDVDKNNGKEKLNRTISSDVKLFQVPQTSQRRKSQEEIDQETRQKMDQFFARVERTKSFQTSRPRWRCSSGVERSARKTTFVEPGGKRPHGGKKGPGYHRAQPWPTQVWS